MLKNVNSRLKAENWFKISILISWRSNVYAISSGTTLVEYCAICGEQFHKYRGPHLMGHIWQIVDWKASSQFSAPQRTEARAHADRVVDFFVGLFIICLPIFKICPYRRGLRERLSPVYLPLLCSHSLTLSPSHPSQCLYLWLSRFVFAIVHFEKMPVNFAFSSPFAFRVL